MDMKEKAKLVLDKIKEETQTTVYRFKLTEEKPGIFDSKVGGLGYAPHGTDFPVNDENEQLRLLAQINCSDIDLEDFPKSGLLQFWVLDEDLVGMDFDDGTDQDGFRVVYYADVDRSVTEDELADKSHPYYEEGEEYFPVSGEYKIEYEKSTDSLAVLSGSDYYGGEELFINKFNEMFPDEKIQSVYDLGFDLDEIGDKSIYNGNDGHKIGGYASFVQFDPRHEDDTHDFLLFQLDSDYSDGKDKVLWGDAGIGNFFINKEKLRQLDFSDVLYNWDCG